MTQDVLPFSQDLRRGARTRPSAINSSWPGAARLLAGADPGCLQKAFRLLLVSKLNTTQALEKIKRAGRRGRGAAGQLSSNAASAG